MLEEVSGDGQHAALHFNSGHIFGFELFRREIVSPPGIDLCSAGKNVDGRVIVLGPGVDREMRFGDHDDSGNSVRVKGMKNDIDDPCPRVLGGINHDRFDFMDIIQNFGIAVVKFDEQMPPE